MDNSKIYSDIHIQTILVQESDVVLKGEKKSITVPYKENFIRSKEHYSNLYYGASIQAFIDIMKTKNYFLIGTNTAGNNAFFVRKDLWKVLNKMILNKKIFMSKFRESRDQKGKLSFLDKKESLNLIRNKHVIDLKSKNQKKIELKLFT